MITNIEISKLHEHPDNPRKNLGDVTELAESIKANGILQNLTVVPRGEWAPDEYTVIIGHRRLAAAKLAGLTEVPCAVCEMDHKTQLATMLLENMQRSDLTVYEQAQGMQMMLDLGETVDDISEKTGFSKSTVYRRVKLLELDADTFKETEGRQVNIVDYDKLFEVKDADRRNKVLATIGTNNFNYELQQAVNQEKREAEKAELCKALNEVAEKITEITGGLYYVGWVNSIGKLQKLKADIPEGYKLYYTDNAYISLYRDLTDEEKAQQEEKAAQNQADADKRERNRERIARLDEIGEQMYQLRKIFVSECTGLKDKAKIITEYLVSLLIEENDWLNINHDKIADILGVEVPVDEDGDPEELTFDLFREDFEKNPERIMLAVAYCIAGDGPRENYHVWNGNYQKNPELDKLYDVLTGLGYELSDEEQALRDGTHELYKEIGAEN